MWGNELCHKEEEQCFGIQSKYQSDCRASGNSHISVNTCGITRARAPGHQPSQILSHTKQYHPPTQQLLAEREEVMYIDFSFVSCWLCWQKGPNDFQLLNLEKTTTMCWTWFSCILPEIMIQYIHRALVLHYSYNFVVKVAKWHTIFTVILR